MSHLVLLQSVVFCFVLNTAERESSAGQRGHCARQSAGSKRATHMHESAAFLTVAERFKEELPVS